MAAFNCYTNGGALLFAGRDRTELNADHKLILFQNEVVWSPSVTMDTLTEADYSGYLRKAVALGVPFLDPVRGGASTQQLAQFDFDGADVTPTTNVIYGYALIYSPGGGDPDQIINGGTFSSPVPMGAAGDSIPLVILQNYGAPPIG